MCRLDGEPMPKYVWVFQLPDGHWEVRFERPEVPATEYVRFTASGSGDATNG
jgi:hypothetical protein